MTTESWASVTTSMEGMEGKGSISGLNPIIKWRSLRTYLQIFYEKRRFQINTWYKNPFKALPKKLSVTQKTKKHYYIIFLARFKCTFGNHAYLKHETCLQIIKTYFKDINNIMLTFSGTLYVSFVMKNSQYVYRLIYTINIT